METSTQQNRDEELIRLYGEFIMRFENICSFMRFTILILLFPEYKKQEFRKIEILLEGLTADSLRKKVLSLVIEDYTSKSEIFNLSKEVYKHVENIIPLRNSFAHGTSLLNKFSLFKEYHDGLLVLRHPKLKGEGLDFNFLTFSIDNMNSLVANMQYLGNAVELLYMIIKKERQGEDILANFSTLIKNNLQNLVKL
jgi:hypothetical protein